MNLIVNRPLGQAEKQLIYELTLKKRKSKKSTMSEKQLLARQQLARELLPHQRMGPMDSLDSFNSSTATTLFSSPIIMNSVASGDDDELQQQQQLYGESIRGALASRNLAKLGSTLSNSSSVSRSSSSSIGSNKLVTGGSSSSAISSTGSSGGGHCEGVNIMSSSLGGASNGSSSGSSSSGCSFSRSDSSYSGSSQDSSNGAANAADELSRRTELELEARKKEANIRFKRSKLDYLNEELGKRLYQYEYLVAQEKALLGTCNMMLFTNEGVNNFHLMRSVRPD